MVVALAIVELHLPQARSLKDKRRVVKGFIDRIHAKFRVSIAETDHHDLHQRAEIAIAVVHQNEHELDTLLESIHRIFDNEPEAYLTRWDPEILEVAR